MSPGRLLQRPRIAPFGDSAVLIDLDLPPGPATTMWVHALADHLSEGQAAMRSLGTGWEPPIPAASTILVPVDPLDPGVTAAAAMLERLVAAWHGSATAARIPGGSTDGTRDVVEIPVHYGEDGGPDLAEVANRSGLSPEAVVAAHSEVEYTVAFLGFAPGFAYLGPLADRLVLPRRPSPRPRVAAGSVGIGGPQTAVYPVDGPGGWWLIGRTPLVVWNPCRTPPALLRPGTRVRFRPVAGG